ncbi:hypothetical protein FJZ40_00670 [Candidatus Shapirobacteria bacterium]|nr:hypothetical protein [Candidatus Shapirobacteria bacterium]
MRSRLLSHDLLVVAVLTLLTVITWIGLDVYRALSKHDTPQVSQSQLVPLSPKVSTNVLDRLEARRQK